MTRQTKLLTALKKAYAKKPTPQLLAKIKAIQQREVKYNWLSQ